MERSITVTDAKEILIPALGLYNSKSNLLPWDPESKLTASMGMSRFVASLTYNRNCN